MYLYLLNDANVTYLYLRIFLGVFSK